ncbi:MAG TPA: Lrp/AsnC family transcriptional regulator [Candidatus Lokiarchaeia archaeon]|nr:Lrp/AsnC family transcriptional regulator [Candidatus Lokiarchaeia archaeon]
MAEKIILNKKLSIDGDDRKIMSLLQENPDLTHSEIAEKINKSQPAVGARILKLERKGLQATQYGIDLKENKFSVALVTMHAKKPTEILDMISCCPFVINAFKTSGKTNVLVWLVGSKLEKLEEIVEVHFRSKPDISHVNMSVIIETIGRLVMPVDFNFESHNAVKCGDTCHALLEERERTGEDYMPYQGDSDVNNEFGIDNDDKRIIMYLQDNPEITHSTIGEKIGKSQPAVGARIAKLKDKKFLGIQKGVNFKLVDQFHIVQVAISALNSTKILDRMKKCPFIITGFRSTGDTSLIVYIAGHSLEKIDDIIDYCVRSDENVKEIETAIILKYMKDLVLPYNFDAEFLEDIGCVDCKHCSQNFKMPQKASKSSKSKSASLE